MADKDIMESGLSKNERGKKIQIYTLLEFICILVIAIVGQCFDWLQGTISFDQIRTATFWTGVIQQIIMYSSALLVGYLFTLEKKSLNDEEFIKDLGLYRIALKFKDSTIFDRYVTDTLNPIIKKEAIKKLYEHKLYMLDKHTKNQEYKLSVYNDLIDKGLNTKDYTNPKDISLQRYIRKRYCYELFRSKSYIDANYERIKCSYEKIDPNIFTEDINPNANGTSKWKTKNTANKDIGKAILKKALWIVISCIFLSSIAFDVNQAMLTTKALGIFVIIIKYAIRVCCIVISTFWGIYNGKNVFYSNFVIVAINRTNILNMYINWKNANNIPDSYANDIFEQYKATIKEKENLEILKQQLAEQTSNIQVNKV